MNSENHSSADETLGLEILKKVSRFASSTLDLDETLQQIIQVIMEELKVDTCAIYLSEKGGKQFQLTAWSGLPVEPSSNIVLEIGMGITGWVAQNKQTLALKDAWNDHRFVYFPEIGEERFKSMLSVPMLFKGESLGVINVHTHEERDFTNSEISILETISSQVSGSINNAMLFRRSEMLNKELSILYDISLAVQTTLKLEHGLWIILSGITMGQAGGFNRAMLFTVNEKENVLQGLMGLGPDSPEDAFRIWSELGWKKGNLLQWIIKEVEIGEYRKSRFNEFARGITVPLRPGEHILAETVLQKKPFNVKNGRSQPLVTEEFHHQLGVDAFSTVPLIAHEEVLGVILVDNRYNGKPITEPQLQLLTRFATHASWVMENSRLFSRLLDTNRELLTTKEQLSETEKLAALGEMAAEVAHEIKNPLVSIGGFARRLQEKIHTLTVVEASERDLESITNYGGIIVKEVSRLEKLLKDTLIYSKSGKLDLEECDLNSLLEEVLDLFKTWCYEKNIEVQADLSPDVVQIPVDKQRIKQVMINLLYNAMESMENGGQLKVKCYNDEFAGRQKMVTITFSDTGGGIPDEVFKNIFNPFFTTKVSGTGMGLSICRKIVEGHGGTIRVENVIGQGVKVILHLPLQKVSDYIKNE